MANLRQSANKLWIAIQRSSVAGTGSLMRTQTTTLRRQSRRSLGLGVAVSGAAVLWWFTSQRTVLAEAPHPDHHKRHTSHYATAHAHAHAHTDGHDKRLVPHAAPVTLSKPVAHDSKAHVADLYAKLEHESLDLAKLPVEEAVLTSAPNVPPSITRDYPVVLKVDLTTTIKKTQLTGAYKYEQWTFNDQVPGPFIRARVGDVVEVTLTNKDESGMPHNIDCHAFLGPGGGSAVTTTEENQTKTARFKLLCPGLFVYHCAAAPVPVHIANGMFGLMYVQPAGGDLLPVDKEYYVMQSEWYHEPPEKDDDGRRSSEVEFSYPHGLREEPNVVVFNGSESALTRDKPLKASMNDTVRIFFGNAGPNLTSAFHVIGSNFRRAYRDGDVVSPPGQFVSTLSVPPGGTTIVDMHMLVPGTMTLVDHAIFRIDKGAVGYLNVSGKSRLDVYQSVQPPAPFSDNLVS
ncbi:hypothetical protein LTR73_008958 [Friedmanniomyces endolithicus]|nr:hypothetical protein LTR73_008958 [Friedmanniomyces endolithicus]